MRKIVFRGKSKEELTLGEWIYGYLFNIEGEKAWIWNGIPQEVLTDTVGQYTGLKDIKGERIWEGDIVRYNCSDKVIVGKVAWCTCFFEVDVRNGAESYALTPFCRVIGNIHDNPELLEGEGS